MIPLKNKYVILKGSVALSLHTKAAQYDQNNHMKIVSAIAIRFKKSGNYHFRNFSNIWSTRIVGQHISAGLQSFIIMLIYHTFYLHQLITDSTWWFVCVCRIDHQCPRGWWGSPTCGPCHCDTDKGFDPNCNKTSGLCHCKVTVLHTHCNLKQRVDRMLITLSLCSMYDGISWHVFTLGWGWKMMQIFFCIQFTSVNQRAVHHTAELLRAFRPLLNGYRPAVFKGDFFFHHHIEY